MSVVVSTYHNLRVGDRVFSSIRCWYGTVLREQSEEHGPDHVVVRFDMMGMGDAIMTPFTITYPADCLRRVI